MNIDTMERQHAETLMRCDLSMVPCSMILNEPLPRFQDHAIIWRWISQKRPWNANRKPYTSFRVVPYSVTFEGHFSTVVTLSAQLTRDLLGICKFLVFLRQNRKKTCIFYCETVFIVNNTRNIQAKPAFLPCDAMHSAACASSCRAVSVRLSVYPSVCHVRVLHRNEYTCRSTW